MWPSSASTCPRQWQAQVGARDALSGTREADSRRAPLSAHVERAGHSIFRLEIVKHHEMQMYEALLWTNACSFEHEDETHQR